MYLGPITKQGQQGHGGVTGTDTQFAAYIGQPESEIFDECVLEFDFQSDGNIISLDYVFGSEEYPGYVCSKFNDAFAFFVSGPGITGLQNIAFIPETTIPVAENSVNAGVPGADAGGGTCNGTNQSLAYSQYYVNNGDGTLFPSSPYGTNPYYIQYNGLTTPLAGSLTGLVPHQTYHAKLVIADVVDPTFDSGVFIEAGSLTSAAASCTAKLGLPRTTTDSLSATVLVGCSEGIIPVQLFHPDTISTTIHFTVGGTALSGIDYVPFADSVVFNAGDSIENLLIQPIGNEQNGVKTIVVKLSSSCVYLTDILYLMDTMAFKVTPRDTTVCGGTAVSFRAINGGSYLWTPGTGLSDSTVANPVAIPDTTIIYLCSTTVSGCTLTDTVRLTTTQIPTFTLSVSPHDTSVCPGSRVPLNAMGGGNSFVWSPGTNLDDNYISDPEATVFSSITYICRYSSGVCSLSDTSFINVLPVPDLPVITLHNDTLQSSPGPSYQWYYYNQPMFGDTNSFITVVQTGEYRVQFIGATGCSSISGVLEYSVTGISMLNNFSSSRLYPNPNNGSFVIEFTDNEVKYVSATDLLGQQILPPTKVVHGQDFDFSAFGAGIYLLKIERLENAGPTVFKQVVIQK